MSKFALFPFRGEPLCFIHVLLNALNMAERGHEAVIVLEGESCSLVGEMAKENHQLHTLYARAKDKGLIAGACKACSTKLGAADAVRAEGLELIEGMHGHPSMAEYAEWGFTVITF
ncbi:MAG: cytoplasmic protein [Oceanidesulfovibrio sp.]